jgi:NADH-quinone oxidoreductase subunit M
MSDFLARPDLLSILIFTPLVGALILLFVPSHRADIHRWGALATSLVAFAVSLLVAVSFDGGRAGF